MQNRRRGYEQRCCERAKAGYESIQFLGHIDSGTNNACCAQVGGAGANTPCRVEIVAVKLNGGFACTDNAAGAQLRAGWQGFCACACTEKALDGYLNCKGTPLHAPNHLTLGNVQRRCDDSCQLPITLSTCKRDGELH